MPEKLGWTDVEEIGIQLCEQHPGVDPLSVRFTQLRELVGQLPQFDPEPGHSVNETILEAIQAAWYEESQDIDRDEDDHFTPPNPFKPE